jgi:hypothetical protein
VIPHDTRNPLISFHHSHGACLSLFRAFISYTEVYTCIKSRSSQSTTSGRAVKRSSRSTLGLRNAVTMSRCSTFHLCCAESVSSNGSMDILERGTYVSSKSTPSTC